MTPDPEKIEAVPAAPSTPIVELAAWQVTDVGMVREHNEDSANFSVELGFFIVADGMGGHAAGEIASAMTVASVTQTLTNAKSQTAAFAQAPSEGGRRLLVQKLQSSVLIAHQAVYARGTSEPEKHGMGTTLDVLLVAGAEAFVAHVGDSRTYLIRDGQCSQITTDHTVAEVHVIEGKLTPAEAAVSPYRNVLVNAIGVSAEVGVEMAHLQLQRGDQLLVCSDGLHDYFQTEEEIAECMAGEDPEASLRAMVEQAKERGGHDNITGIVVLVKQVRAPVDVPDFHERDSTQPVDFSKLDDDKTTEGYEPIPASIIGDLPKRNDQAVATPAAGRSGPLHRPRQTQPMRAMRDGIPERSPVVPGVDSTEPIGRITPPIGLRALAHADTLPPDAQVRANADGSITLLEPGLSTVTPKNDDGKE
ncbi:MAG: serine/threonine-protein phosphatase [Kofleriaceae bacterium]|nr:serine/threonine-protein phosphatase [Kofleriaceae bacterium]